MKYCQECGAELRDAAEICPDCGVRQFTPDEDDDRSERAKQFIWAGISLGALGILFLPIVFAPLAALCGVLALYYGRPMAGAGVVVWAVFSGILGFVIGFIGLALL